MNLCLRFVCLCLFAAVARADEFTSSGVKFFYTVQGSGSPLVLIHGLHSSGTMNWTMPGTTAALSGGMITLKTAVLHPERVQGLLLCDLGWLQDGSTLQGFWEHIPVRESLIGGSSGSACMKGMARLAVTEAEVKALKMPAAIIVGDRDPMNKLYVFPLTQIRPDWPVTKITGAGHITCVMKPGFRDEVAKAIANFEN